jgi:small subunit ribosomal protein S4
MATYRDAKCRLCRREGEKLFLKGNRCFTDKCAIDRRGYAPGEHGRDRRQRETNYGMQLREKQKARRTYGVLEAQFRTYFHRASRASGVTGLALLQLLETRLDNVVYRMGFAPSRTAARQLVGHRHFTVNGRIVNIPSFRVKPGDVVKVREKSRGIPVIKSSIENRRAPEALGWLDVDAGAMTGKLVSIPSRVEIPVQIQEQLIVELYSK